MTITAIYRKIRNHREKSLQRKKNQNLQLNLNLYKTKHTTSTTSFKSAFEKIHMKINCKKISELQLSLNMYKGVHKYKRPEDGCRLFFCRRTLHSGCFWDLF